MQVGSLSSIPGFNRQTSKQSTASGYVNAGNGLPPVAPLGHANRHLMLRSSESSQGGDYPVFDGQSSLFDGQSSPRSAVSSRFGSKRPVVDLMQTKSFGLQLGAGWSNRPTANQKLDKPLDRGSATDFSNFAMSQLNQMYAHMEQAMLRERARHSSDVQLLMRKVDKDLKDTFRAVREAFVSLTQQVQELLREVETGKKNIAVVQTKFDAAKSSAAIRAQYVEELEAVLDGQVPNISEAMSKLSEDLTRAKMHVDKVDREAAEKEAAVIQEKSATRAIIRSLEERLNEKEVLGFAGATELPLLPEMSASWTRRQVHEAGSDDIDSLDGGSGLNIIMARSDATRAVTRNKCVRPQGLRPLTTPGRAPTTPRNLTRGQQQQCLTEVAELRKRAAEADERVARQHALFLDAAPSLQLLRNIFAELRENWRLQASDQEDDKELEDPEKAPDILDNITHLFVTAFPNLGCFSQVLEALCKEAKRPAPKLSAVADALLGIAPASESGAGSATYDGSRRTSAASASEAAEVEEAPTPMTLSSAVWASFAVSS